MNEKISITLPREMVDVIRRRVEAGDYASNSEVLLEAMSLWIRHEEEHRERIAAIRTKVKASLDDPRPNLSGDEVRGRVASFIDRHR